MVEKMFGTSIPVTTLEKRAERIREKFPTNVGKSITIQNHSELSKNQVCHHGGAREGSGRPPKYEKPPEPWAEPWSCANAMALVAIGQLARIAQATGRRGLAGAIAWWKFLKKPLDIFGIMAIMGINHIWEFSHEPGKVLFLRKP